MRVSDEPAYILHHHDYGETSLLFEVFTRVHGRLPMVAKGARRAKSPLRPALIPFQLLGVGFSGRGEVLTLTRAEPLAPAPAFVGETLYCGLYLNELLLRLLHRHDPHERLFLNYGDTLLRLGSGESREQALRLFEKRLLEEIGYGLVLDQDVENGSPLIPDRQYSYLPERGPVPLESGYEGITVQGQSLISLARENLQEESALRDAKRLLRSLLIPHLGPKPLMTRQLFRPERTRDALE